MGFPARRTKEGNGMSNSKVLIPLIPIIRRVMPTIIAQDIVGVQPMSGPIIDILTRQTGYSGRVVLTKSHFGHFLRIYNRRKAHHPDYITSLGYEKFRIRYSDVIEAKEWCRKTFKPGAYIRSMNDFWFANERDALLFSLRWPQT